MDNTNESQEFDLDDILREFHDDPDEDVIYHIGITGDCLCIFTFLNPFRFPLA